MFKGEIGEFLCLLWLWPSPHLVPGKPELRFFSAIHCDSRSVSNKYHPGCSLQLTQYDFKTMQTYEPLG